MEANRSIKNNSISTIHDIKETAKRATQFCYVAIAVSSITVVTNVIYGNTLSAILVAGLIAALAVMVWINKKGNPRVAKFCLVLVLNAFLVMIAFAEGLNTASTLYFLPLLFAIPFFIENTKNYKQQVGLFFTITLICFAVCVVFCHKTSSYQFIPDAIFKKMVITNSFCSFTLCALFAYLSIHLERKYSNELLKQMNKTQEAMEARTKFLSSMGHELRTPLNGIIGATNLLRNGESLMHQKDYLDILKYCSDHMLGLVNDILDFNKIEAGQLHLHPIECNLKKLLKQSTLPFFNRFEEKKLDLLVNVDDELNETVLIDDLRIIQVINNLLSNALKFTEKGFVKLEVKQIERQESLATIEFSVQDSGIGIKESDQKKIFGSFWQVYNETTRKYSGTGLGLTICQRLLQLMNSELLVNSEEGKGSRFYFTVTVPVITGKQVKKSTPEQNLTDLDGVKILLAEDNIINLMIAKKFLEDKNALIVTAQNGQEALDILEVDPGFDIILLDLEMPVMDGYTAIAKMREKYPDIPVLAFTAALMDQEMLQDLHALGFLDFILKPFQPAGLYAKVRKYAKPVLV